MLQRLTKTSKALITHIKGKQDYLKHAKANKSYILNFSAEWCGPCKALAPTLEKKQKQGNGKWAVLKVNVDLPENQALNEEYQMQSIPMMIFYKDGKEVDRVIGGLKPEALDEKIKKIL